MTEPRTCVLNAQFLRSLFPQPNLVITMHDVCLQLSRIRLSFIHWGLRGDFGGIVRLAGAAKIGVGR